MLPAFYSALILFPYFVIQASRDLRKQNDGREGGRRGRGRDRQRQRDLHPCFPQSLEPLATSWAPSTLSWVLVFFRDLRSGRSYDLILRFWRRLRFLTPLCTYLPAKVPVPSCKGSLVMCESSARWRQRTRTSPFLTQGLLDFSTGTGYDQELPRNSCWYPEPYYEAPPATRKNPDCSLLCCGGGEKQSSQAEWCHLDPTPFSPPSLAKALIHPDTPAAP